MTRMGITVGEGRYVLAGDLLQAFLPLLYVGDGVEVAAGDECGVDFLAGLSLGGGKGAWRRVQWDPDLLSYRIVWYPSLTPQHQPMLPVNSQVAAPVGSRRRPASV